MRLAWSRFVTLDGKDGFSLLDPRTGEPRGFQGVFLSILLEPGPKGPYGPPSIPPTLSHSERLYPDR